MCISILWRWPWKLFLVTALMAYTARPDVQRGPSWPQPGYLYFETQSGSPPGNICRTPVSPATWPWKGLQFLMCKCMDWISYIAHVPRGTSDRRCPPKSALIKKNLYVVLLRLKRHFIHTHYLYGNEVSHSSGVIPTESSQETMSDPRDSKHDNIFFTFPFLSGEGKLI